MGMRMFYRSEFDLNYPENTKIQENGTKLLLKLVFLVPNINYALPTNFKNLLKRFNSYAIILYCQFESVLINLNG